MNQTKTHGAILYAEDSEDDAFFLRRAYRQAKIPHPLKIVTDGALVLPYLEGADAFEDRERFPFPYLVLLDVKMPKMGGLEVLKAIRARPAWRNLAVCLLTSSSQSRDVERASQLGANGYIVKPANAELLRGILADLDALARSDPAPTGCWKFAENHQCSVVGEMCPPGQG